MTRVVQNLWDKWKATNRSIIKKSLGKKDFYNNRQITDDLEVVSGPKSAYPKFLMRGESQERRLYKNAVCSGIRTIMFYLRLSSLSSKPASEIVYMQLKWLKGFVSHMLCVIISNCTVFTGWPLTGFLALKQPVGTHGHVTKHSTALSGIAEGLLNEHRESLLVLAHLLRRGAAYSPQGYWDRTAVSAATLG